jgi:hypothetical protein
MARATLTRTTKPVQSLAPALRAASANGAAVDRKGFGDVMVVVSPGALTDGVHTPKLQAADDDPANPGTPLAASWADVAAADLVGALAAVVANTLQWVGYRGVQRYVRVVLTVTGAPATGAIVGANVVLGDPAKVPTA